VPRVDEKFDDGAPTGCVTLVDSTQSRFHNTMQIGL
jgi:hypothetical protein